VYDSLLITVKEAGVMKKNHDAAFKAKVALEAVKGESTL